MNNQKGPLKKHNRPVIASWPKASWVIRITVKKKRLPHFIIRQPPLSGVRVSLEGKEWQCSRMLSHSLSLSLSLLFCTRSGTWTRTGITAHWILSPACLPFHHPGSSKYEGLRARKPRQLRYRDFAPSQTELSLKVLKPAGPRSLRWLCKYRICKSNLWQSVLFPGLSD